MYKIIPTNQFKKDLKQLARQGKDLKELETVIDLLAADQILPERYRDHLLTGNWRNHRECHIGPDWLLIYKKEKGLLILTLARTGSHSELF